MKFSRNGDGDAKALSMYYGSPIIYKDQLFNSAIHILSWHKCKSAAFKGRVMLASDPMQAGFMGTSIGRGFMNRHNNDLVFKLRLDWEASYRVIMWKILRLKWEQCLAVQHVLKHTENHILIDADEKGANGYLEATAPNICGKMWMKIRRINP